MTLDDTSGPVARYPDLAGRRVLVLGTGDGIGQKVVAAFAANDAAVACFDLDPARAEAAAALVPRSVALTGDITRPEAVAAAFDEAIAAFGSLDLVVDVVGMLRPSLLVDTDEDSWRWHFGVVFDHARRVVAEAGRRLAAGSALVFVTSGSAFYGVRRNGPYAAAKAAQLSVVRTAAAEFAASGIRVNAVAPGIIANPRMTALLEASGGLEATLAAIPSGRLVEPAEVADAILFLASRSSSAITGQALVIDGGVQSTWPYPDL